MNAVGVDRDDLIAALRRYTSGLRVAEAAVELLVGHGHWLRREPFLRCVEWYPHDDQHDDMALVDWHEVRESLDSGDLPGTASERSVLAVAGSIDAGTPVDLGDVLLSCDQSNVRLIAAAVLHAGGAR